MNCRIVFFLLSLPFFGSAQDTISNTKQTELVKRFDDILGQPKTVSSDSLVKLRSTIDTLMSSMVIMQASIQTLTIKNDRSALIDAYGEPGKWVAYDTKQKQLFGANTFLKDLEAQDKGSHIYFAFNETQADFSAYKEALAALADQWKVAKNQRIYLDGYSDASGKNKVNMALSQERSLQVMRYMMTEFSLPESAFTITYHGAKGDSRFKEKELDFLNRQVYVEVR